jgi:hypothetical protein
MLDYLDPSLILMMCSSAHHHQVVHIPQEQALIKESLHGDHGLLL